MTGIEHQGFQLLSFHLLLVNLVYITLPNPSAGYKHNNPPYTSLFWNNEEGRPRLGLLDGQSGGYRVYDQSKAIMTLYEAPPSYTPIFWLLFLLSIPTRKNN